QGIPTELYEAASIDGAGALQRLAHITLPMMTPVIFFQLIMGLINSFQYFTQAFIMTGGGPNNATLFYVLYLYRTAFQRFRMGYAATLGVVLFIVILVLAMILMRTSKYWVFYEAEERGR
ncbi:MAG TPA: sugar ABC transporter permease, partial [Clostridia bacterium]|nr:sugar ABC transporter permease [Clostridia bacterium]